VSSAVFGFFFMAAARSASSMRGGEPPGAGVHVPGLLVLSVRFGAIFIVLMSSLGNVSMDALADATRASGSVSLTPFMIRFLILSVLNLALGFRMKESSMIREVLSLDEPRRA